ncbi:MAG TPA: hypothetical protein VGR43_01205 [Dehalococcoidia bacterium]|nr:hypothetical protein [Dehalococcoidia bacterium]
MPPIAVSAVVFGVYYRFIILRPLPPSVGLSTGLALIAAGALVLGSILGWWLRSPVAISTGALLGLLIAATRVVLRTTDTLIGPWLAFLDAVEGQGRYLAILTALIAAGSSAALLLVRRPIGRA